MIFTERESLRRLDWRFLFPFHEDQPYRSALVFGCTDSQIRLLSTLDFATNVYDGASDYPESKVDVVVVRNKSSISIADATKFLAPTGIIYGEIDRTKLARLFCGPFWLNRVLKKNNLELRGLYAIQPHFDGLEMYMPLDHSYALGWFLKNQYIAKSWLHKLLKFLLGAICGSRGELFKYFSPFIAFVAVPEGYSADISILHHDGCKEALGETKASLLMFSDAGNRVVLLPFKSGSTIPELIFKIPKLASFNDRTKKEQRNLQFLQNKTVESIRSSIPKGLGMLTSRSKLISVEKYLDGKLLQTSDQKSVTQDFEHVARWLTDFHEGLHQKVVWTEEESHLWIGSNVTKYKTIFSSTSEEVKLFELVENLSTSLIGQPILKVYCHRDFNVWNILRSEAGDIRVIDWEGGRWGLPLCDLIHFSTHWHDHAMGCTDLTTQLLGFENQFFNRSSKFFDTTWTHFSNYLDRLGVSNKFIPVLFVYTWVELAIRRYEQLSDMGMFNENMPRENNRNFHFISLIAENYGKFLAD